MSHCLILPLFVILCNWSRLLEINYLRRSDANFMLFAKDPLRKLSRKLRIFAIYQKGNISKNTFTCVNSRFAAKVQGESGITQNFIRVIRNLIFELYLGSMKHDRID